MVRGRDGGGRREVGRRERVRTFFDTTLDNHVNSRYVSEEEGGVGICIVYRQGMMVLQTKMET